MAECTESPSGWMVTGAKYPAHGKSWGVVFLELSSATAVMLEIAADGEVITFEVKVRQHGQVEASAITARSLRAIPFGALADIARAKPEVHFEDLGGGQGKLTARWEDAPVPRPGRQRGRERRSDLYCAELAYAYRLWQATGQPLSALADKARLSVTGLRTALTDTRTRGFLTEAPSGRKGGAPTEKALEVIREHFKERVARELAGDNGDDDDFWELFARTTHLLDKEADDDGER